MAREVTVDENGPRDAASPTSTRTRSRDNHVRARIVVLAASACESARILLNSKSSKFPQGLGEFDRHRRQVPDRFHRHRRDRVHPEDDGQPPAQRGRRRRRAPLHAVVAGQQEARLPARLSHRDRRRPPDAGRRLPRQHPRLHRRGGVGHADLVRRLRQEPEARLPPRLRIDGQLRRPRRDGARTRTPTWSSIRASSTSGASRCCASTSSGATTRSSSRSTCRRPSAASSTRWAARRCRRCRRRPTNYGLAPGGRIIHELGVIADGQRPEHVGR